MHRAGGLPRVKAPLLVAILVAGGLGAALALPAGDLASLLDLAAERLPPPPEIRLSAPSDGQGVEDTVALAGDALSTARDVLDVQYRIDGGRWTSIADAPRGQRAIPFATSLPLGPGDHVIEARAWDGEAYSLPARALVRRDAPTVRITSPSDGASLPTGALEVTGTLAGAASRVLVTLGDATYEATVVGAAWRARVDVPAGIHDLRATALADVPSLPARARIAADDPVPPSLTVVAPREGAAYGETGDFACGGGCILVAGASQGAARVLVSVDGFDAREAEVSPGGAWSARLPILGLANGPHDLVATPVDADGRAGVARAVRILARASDTLRIEGDDAPAPTGTPLAFAVADGAGASWTLDGLPVGEGDSVVVTLGTPGDHVLAVHVPTRGDGASSATRPLHALNRLPDVSFVGDPTLVGASMRFEALAEDPDGRVVEYAWEFGDGNAATTRMPVVLHRYAERAAYAVALRAIDDHGGIVTLGTSVVVPNALPTLSFAWSPEEPTVLDVVTLRHESHDPDGAIVESLWRFADGTTSANATPTLRFSEPGPHAVTLRAWDDTGALAELTKEIVVANLPPEPRFRHDPAAPRSQEEVLFVDLSADLDTPLARRVWDFGDGATAEGATVLHAFASAGPRNVTLTVTDALGATSNLTLPIHVADSAPDVSAVLVDPPAPRTFEDVRFEALASDRDGSPLRFTWDFGDGATSNESQPVHRYARSGFYAGSVSVLDEAGLRAVLPFQVPVANTPPTAALGVEGLALAAFPTTLVADAHDPDGRVALYRFDADGDGRTDCETTEPVCRFVYDAPGVHAARLAIEDDEMATATAALLVEVGAPPPDHPPPRVSVESPLPEARVRGEYLFRGAAEGVRPIARVELQVQDAAWAYSGSPDAWRLVDGAEDWRALVDTRGFPDGAFELVVRATDSAGGVGYARVPILIENGERLSDVSVKLADAPAVVEESALVRGSAFHPLGVTSVRWRIDEGPWQLVAQDPLAFVLELDREDLAPGPHVLQVEAYRGPTESANATHVFEVPGVAPTLVIDEPPSPIAYGLLRAGGRIVGQGHAQWRLDHDVWKDIPPGETWLLARETTGVQGGRHTLDLRAVSPDGRLTSETKSYSIQVVNPSAVDGPARAAAPPRTAQEIPAPGLGFALALGLGALIRRTPPRP